MPCNDGAAWLHFDLVPEEFQIREGAADYTGRLCVIGSDLKEDRLFSDLARRRDRDLLLRFRGNVVEE